MPPATSASAQIEAVVNLEKLALMRETDARRTLGDAAVRFVLLAPIGSHTGRGALRVLRVRPLEGELELVCGYEAYDQI